MSKAIGKRTWAISGGDIPLVSSGPEPAFTSHDKISILNTDDSDAHLELMVYYQDCEPAGPYKITVKGRRTCKIWFNDLIDPLPVPLNKPFACVVTADIPVVIQFSRMDTSSAHKAITGTIAYSCD